LENILRVGGSAARTFTTLVEVNDKMIITIMLSNLLLNVASLAQFFIYPAGVTKKDRKKAKQQ